MSQPALLRSTYALLGEDVLQAIETHGQYMDVPASKHYLWYAKVSL